MPVSKGDGAGNRKNTVVFSAFINDVSKLITNTGILKHERKHTRQKG
jgi:hypothetical protein